VGSYIEDKREKYRRYAEKIKLLNGLPPEFVRQVIHAGESFMYQHAGIITREGAPCTAMFIVIKGQITLYERGVFLDKCVAGDSFCELGVLVPDFKSPTAVADMETQLLGLEEPAVRKLLTEKEGSKLLMNFLKILCARQTVSRERIVQLHSALKSYDEAACDRIAQRAFEPKARPSSV